MTEPKRPANTAGLAPSITDSDQAREYQRRAVASRLAKKEQTREMEKEHAQQARQIQKLETSLADARAAIIEAKADAKVARGETAAIRRRLEAEVTARAAAEKRAPNGNRPALDPLEVLDRAAADAVRTLSSTFRALATAAKAGEGWRSGADAGALLDALVRSAAALQAMQATSAGSSTSTRRPAAAIEAGAVDVATLASSLRARLEMAAPRGSETSPIHEEMRASDAVSRDHAEG